MEATDLGTLAVLALVDGTSIGTLAIPVWLLLSPDVRASRVALYLGVVAGLYAALGVVLLVGGKGLVSAGSEVLDGPAADWVLLVVGVALFALSFVVDRGGSAEARARSNRRVARWRERAVEALSSPRGIAALALVAVASEAATMLPYLAGVGIVVAADIPAAAAVGVLLVYCLVMVAPAGGLLAARAAAGPRVDPVLSRVDEWIERNAAALLGTLLGVAGFFLAAGAVQRLELI